MKDGSFLANLLVFNNPEGNGLLVPETEKLFKRSCLIFAVNEFSLVVVEDKTLNVLETVFPDLNSIDLSRWIGSRLLSFFLSWFLVLLFILFFVLFLIIFLFLALFAFLTILSLSFLSHFHSELRIDLTIAIMHFPEHMLECFVLQKQVYKSHQVWNSLSELLI